MTRENVGSVIYTATYNEIRAEWILSSYGKVARGTGVGLRLSCANLVE